ncbi:OmpA family protein [Hymenobacter sp. BT770]|uniref:OmpA family protein n=1 Tax=Hymenobacter sp. BT770 TaxID=2886942 RepID=UPI001D0F9582|nr:OmpA family protein [Hymenobacter sp. BT770]MCC3152400.1 OmpA family protein [Hymenobacter sp. BT770]MDO3414624.1 OmpA family protein [Hymenobacter sp. BT770]
MDNLSRRLLQASCAVALTATIASPAQAQSTRKDLKTGNKFFEQENYRAALPYYEKVLAKDPNNAKALFNAGISYMSFDKEKASDYIYKAQKIKPKVSKDVEYWLGRVDHLNYNFDEAVAHFQAYNATLKKNDQRKEELAQLIQHSKNAKVQFNSPKDIFVKNLGPTINTQFSEHSPVISSDDKLLIYTSRGENVTGATGKPSDKKNKSIAADGEYYEDIFEATRLDDENWNKPRSLSGVLNGKGHDASTQLFDNDTKLLMYRNDNNGDIFISEKSGGDWTAPKPLGSNINSKSYEGDAYITPDGLTLYFSTGRYSEDGTLDLYVSTRASMTDEFGPAKSLGGAINTKYDDDSPYLSKDGKTLYFSSRGHNTMGGYDIFKSEYNPDTRRWGEAQNLGYPINTPDDDSYYRLSPDGSYAYLSSYRIGGYGEKDIYTINYIKNAIIKGKVFSSKDSTTVIPGVELVFTGAQADKTALSFRDVTKPDGAYQVAVLSGRTYQVAVSKDGKNIETQEFAVPVSTNDSTTITKNFYVNYIDTTTLANGMFKNIYFDTDKYKLRPESITELNNTAQKLMANTGINISIEGHCDSRNTDEYNMVLGQNRADAAKNYLKKQGIAESRMTTVSYGERRPAAPNDSPENMQLNRRDEFRPVMQEGATMPTTAAPAAPAATDTTGTSGASTTGTTGTAVPLAPGKSKVKMADGTKVKTKVDEDSDKVKVKTKSDAGDTKTKTKNGELDGKAKDANGEKTKIKTKNE